MGKGKWGHGEDRSRLYRYPALKKGAYQWLLTGGDAGKKYCDDDGADLTTGDFWKIFVR